MTEINEEQNHIQLQKRTGFFKFVAILVIIGIIFTTIEAYFYLIHPEPEKPPTLQTIQTFLEPTLENAFSSHSPEEVKKVINAVQSDIKQVANFIVSQSCPHSDIVCQSKALFYFVRDEIHYVPDDHFHDELENPLTVLKTGGADCEDMAVLLIALQKAIGNETRLVFVPGHAFAQVKIEGYKGGKWINLEGTCETCQFGELPTNTGIQKKKYFEI